MSRLHLGTPRLQLDVSNRLLLARGRPVPLRRKSFELLVQLAQNPGRLWSKKTLLAAVWRGTHVSDTVLKVCIHELRRALGDERRQPRFIETVHGQGYRFIAEMAMVLPEA